MSHPQTQTQEFSWNFYLFSVNTMMQRTTNKNAAGLCALKIQYRRIPKSMVPLISNTFLKVTIIFPFLLKRKEVTKRHNSLWAYSIQLKFPEILVQNRMEQKVFGNMF